MEISVDKSDPRFYLVEIQRDLTPENAFHLQEVLNELKECVAKHTLLDFNLVANCSNSALGVMIEYIEYLNSKGYEVIIFSVCSTIRRLLSENNITQDLIRREPDKKRAIEYINKLTQQFKSFEELKEKAEKTARLKKFKLDKTLKQVTSKALDETKRIRAIVKDLALQKRCKQTERFFELIAQKLADEEKIPRKGENLKQKEIFENIYSELILIRRNNEEIVNLLHQLINQHKS
mgnify:CR=1 FL=1